MMLGTSVWNRWTTTWRAVIPRTRLSLNLARPLMLLAALMYVIILALIYLHILGQIAAIRAATLRLDQALQLQVERNALLQQEAVLPVDRIAAASEMMEATVSLYPERAFTQVSRQPLPVSTPEEAQTAPFWRAWWREFGLDR